MAFADDQLARYEALMAKAVGLKSVSVDGQSVAYEELETRWKFWKREVAKAAGTKPAAANVDLAKAW